MTLVEGLMIGAGMGLAQGVSVLLMVAVSEHYRLKHNKEAVDAGTKKFAESVERFRQAFADELAAAPTQRPPADLS